MSYSLKFVPGSTMQKKKIIPKDIIHDLTPLEIAAWIMDDGCRSRDSLILNTQSFSEDEQHRLLKALESRYGIVGLINRDRNNFRLRFNRENMVKLSGLSRPYVVESLMNKIVPVSTELRTTTEPVVN